MLNTEEGGDHEPLSQPSKTLCAKTPDVLSAGILNMPAQQNAPVLFPLLQTMEETAATLLRREGQALCRLAERLPPHFQAVVQCLAAASGKVVLSGVGKSGHIGQKIASTFCSTGTPAYFLHPTEAGHGDLGGLAAGDILMLLSNSGETPELLPLIQFAHHINLPLVSVTSNADSTLAKSSRFVLPIPREEEVCHLGLAPTTSALLMLGLGDALAVCLSQLRNFQSSDYKLRHPSGSLGFKLLKVRDLMRRGPQLPLVPVGTLMRDGLLIMNEKACGCLGVIHEATGKLSGIITDGDLRRHMSTSLLEQTVEEIMTPHPFTVDADLLASEALQLMNMRKITVLFVHDAAHQTVGLLHMHDCLRVKG